MLDVENFGKFISQIKKNICLNVFPGGSVVKNPPANAGDVGSVPWAGKNLWRMKYSCLGNLMDRGAWRALVHGVAEELDMT